MKKIIRLTENDIRKIVKRVIKESDMYDFESQYDDNAIQFEEDLETRFYEDFKELCENAIEKIAKKEKPNIVLNSLVDPKRLISGYSGFKVELSLEYAEKYAHRIAHECTMSSIKLLESDDWYQPRNNSRSLEYVMGKNGIRNYSELVERDDAVELFIGWFWESHNYEDFQNVFVNDLNDSIANKRNGAV